MPNSSTPNPKWRQIPLALLTLALSISVASAADKAPVDIDDIPLKGSPVGKPQDRIGAGARGEEVDGAEVFLIAPEQIGASAESQPVLYWYLTRKTDFDVDFVITESQDDKGARVSDVPLMKKKYDGEQKAGLHAVNLAAEHIALKANVPYRVTVVLHSSPANDNSNNPFSSGYLISIARPATLGVHPDGPAFAREGLWYDAIDAIITSCCQDPSKAHPRKQLCGLAWNQHVFYSLPRGKAADASADAKAKELAKAREATRLKQFEQLLENEGK